MPIARVQHTYNHKSGMPEDAVVNTFHFDSGIGGAAVSIIEGAILGELVMDFYDEVPTGASGDIQSQIAEASMAPNRHTVKVYDLGDEEPRVPVYTLTTNHGTANNSVPPGPAEVAICLSYRGTIESGIPMARKRGRIYVGPINAGAGEADVAGHFRPVAAFATNLVMAGKQLQVSARAAGWKWVVRSNGGPAGGGGDFPFTSEIVHCWCDNAFDTQRRRGPSATSRVTETF